MREVVRDEIQPLQEEVRQIKTNTQESLDADVLALRCNMKAIYDRTMQQGFADMGDQITMKELYDKYRALGGNHFEICVDA